MSQLISAEGELTWFSPVIPEEDYEIRVGDKDLVHDLLLLGEYETKENHFNNEGRVGPWYRLKGKRVKITIEVMDV